MVQSITAKFVSLCREVEDYAVLYFGSAIFKVARLLFIAGISVHFFACIFYRVKHESAVDPDDVTAFYVSRNADPHVNVHIGSQRCYSI